MIEQQTYLAQSRATEVMDKATWKKAAGQLDRVLGQTLEKSGILLQGDPASQNLGASLKTQGVLVRPRATDRARGDGSR
jgi:hypothetical protein